MPLLKDLNCSIELSGDQEPLQELGTVYGDAFVETFIPVPKKQQTFTIHLSSRNFIAPGIAMYVFIDGVYQCNRNRQDMKLRRPPDRRSLVDFKVRQKEERQKDGSMIAREWTFEKLDQASADDAPDSCSPNILDNIGCIEVVVLRCAGTRNAKTAANMNLDGVTDYPDYKSDRDSRSRSVAYDDREPFKNTTHGRYGPLGSEPLFRSPYAESTRDRKYRRDGRSLYSAPLNPGTRPHRDIAAPAFQYGSGPLPPLSRVDSQRGLMGGNISNISPRSVPAVDPGMLEKIVTDAVKRGVKEARKTDRSETGHRSDIPRYHEGLDTSSQVPGAWPASPGLPSRHPSYSASKRHSSRSRAGTRVAWDEEPEWGKDSKSNGWSSPERKVDSWDTDETWSGKPLRGWDERCRRSKSASRTSQEPHRARGLSNARDHVSRKRRSRHRSSEKVHVRSRSHWMNDASSPSGDSVVSISVEVPTDSCTSLEQSDSTLKPSHSRSQTQPPKKESVRRSSGHKRSGVRPERRPSKAVDNRQLYPLDIYQAQSPSVLVTNAPTMVPVPMAYNPADVQSRKASVYSQAPNSIAAPPPTWGCASDRPRKKSAATSFLPPAPFSVIGGEGRKSRQASGSSSWGISGEKVAEIKAGNEAGLQDASWGEGRQSHNDAKSVWGTDADVKTTDWEEDQTHEWGADNDKDRKNHEWSSDEKGNGGWDVVNTAKEPTGDDWDETKNDNDWGEPTSKGAAEEDWNIANNENGWEQNDTLNMKQNDSAAFQNDNPWGVTWEPNTPWTPPQDTTKPNNGDALNTEPSNIWQTIPTTNNAPNPPPRSKHHTSNSISNPHPLLPVSSPPVAHRKFPPPPPKHPPRTSPNTPRIPASLQHKIPLAAAAAKGVQHQVLAGPGTAYGHAVSRPEYVDSLERPYAVFRFKYRSRSMLRGMFGGECLGVGGGRGREGLEGLGRGELVQRLRELRMKMRRRGVAGGSESETGEKEKEEEGEEEGSVKRGFTERWVDEQSRGRSVGKGGVKRGEKMSKGFDPEKVQW